MSILPDQTKSRALADLHDERVDAHDGVHPFPAEALLVPIFSPVWRDVSILCIHVRRYDDAREAGPVSRLHDIHNALDSRGVRKDGTATVEQPVAGEFDPWLDHPAQ